MKIRHWMVAILLPVLAGLTGCQDGAKQDTTPPKAPPPPASEMTGTVIETMDSGRYTYVQVDDGKETFWVAGPQSKIEIGKQVFISSGMWMNDFHSESLDRTFPRIYFASGIGVPGAVQPPLLPPGHPDIDPGTTSGSEQTPAKLPKGHPSIDSIKKGAPVDIDLSGIAKPEGGQTVAEIFARVADLSGQEVSVRGKAVKYTSQVMGKNWIHLRDGTGEDGSNDLTVTTAGTAKIGDLILVTGVVHTNKDFGFGYQYDVIIEDAKIVVE